MNVRRPGNPHGKDPGPQLTKVTLMIDAETLLGLQKLEKQWGPDVRGRRSAVIRAVIRQAAEK